MYVRVLCTRVVIFTCRRERAQNRSQAGFLLVQHRLGGRLEHTVQLGHAPDTHFAHFETVHLQLEPHRVCRPPRVV